MFSKTQTPESGLDSSELLVLLVIIVVCNFILSATDPSQFTDSKCFPLDFSVRFLVHTPEVRKPEQFIFQITDHMTAGKRCMWQYFWEDYGRLVDQRCRLENMVKSARKAQLDWARRHCGYHGAVYLKVTIRAYLVHMRSNHYFSINIRCNLYHCLQSYILNLS